MTPSTITARPESFTKSANDFETIHEDVRSTLERLFWALSVTGKMAGSDSVGRTFASNYDKTVNGDQSLLAGIALVGNACGKMAELLDASATNHANVDESMATCSPTNPSGDPKNLGTISIMSLGTSFGGPGEPSNWESLKGFIQGEIFPDGDPDLLDKAGDAWTRAASDLRGHQKAVRSAIAHIASERSVEVGPAQDQAGLIVQHFGGVADSCDAVAKLCHGCATHIRDTRNQIAEEVKQLACELVAGAAIGFALTLLSGGLSNVLATAAGVARATQTGARIAKIIHKLAATVGQVVRPAAYVLDPVTAAAGDLGALLGARAAVFTTQLSKSSVRAAHLAAALDKIPHWAHDELKRAADPDLLRKALEEGGVPKHMVDDAIENNPYRNLTPQQILDRYWDGKGWAYPPNNGFAGEYQVSDRIPEGTQLDRIGSSGGGFMGRDGDSYSDRALPPGKAGPYKEYVGTGQPLPDEWEVRHGKIGEAFGQRGGGYQWVVVDKDTGNEIPVSALKERGLIAPKYP